MAATSSTASACIVTLIVAVPLYISVMGGFKTMGQLQAEPVRISPSLRRRASTSTCSRQRSGHFWRQLGESAWSSRLDRRGASSSSASFAAFALARIRFRLNDLIYGYFQLGLLFPLAVAILPLYLQLRNLGLVDRLLGVILPQVAFQVPMERHAAPGLLQGDPARARGGRGDRRLRPVRLSLFQIVVPLSTPILATAAILTLVASWNNFFTPLIVFNTATKFTLPMGVMDFMGQHGAAWNLILAFLTLAMVPAVVIFILCQKYIVAGLTGGAIKG